MQVFCKNTTFLPKNKKKTRFSAIVACFCQMALKALHVWQITKTLHVYAVIVWDNDLSPTLQSFHKFFT